MTLEVLKKLPPNVPNNACTVRVILKEEDKDWLPFLVWDFVECPPKEEESHYGNGYYISATRRKDHYNTHIDCRYMKGYDFKKAVEGYLKDYYGEANIKAFDYEGVKQ